MHLYGTVDDNTPDFILTHFFFSVSPRLRVRTLFLTEIWVTIWSEVDVDFKNTMAELGVFYRVAQYQKTDREILGGARYVKQELEVKGIPLPPLSSLSNKEDWWDAIVGGRVKVGINDKWLFVGRADYGFGGSDGTWNLVGYFDYRFRDWGSVFFGYQWMDFDYESGGGSNRYVYDATQQGPLAGLNLYW
jgi:hypothetical protein